MYYGWRVVAGAFIGMVLANGIFTYGFTVLVDPIRVEFDASLESVAEGIISVGPTPTVKFPFRVGTKKTEGLISPMAWTLVPRAQG